MTRSTVGEALVARACRKQAVGTTARGARDSMTRVSSACSEALLIVCQRFRCSQWGFVTKRSQ
jgi:hypothetical protein